jgi:two-component sensor histidine kinase
MENEMKIDSEERYRFLTEKMNDMIWTLDLKLKTTNSLLQFYLDSSRIDCDLNIDDIRIDINKAIPCSLILNELISNALKHAFPSGESAKIVVSMQMVKKGLCEIRIKDNGIGLKGNIEELKAHSMGLELVTLLTDQLNGKLSVKVNKGTEFKILFPIGKNV